MTFPSASKTLIQHLIEVPKPDNWPGQEKPVIFLDGQFVDLKSKALVEGKRAFVVGANDKTFPQVCNVLRASTIEFYEMRVQDLTPIHSIQGLQHLSIDWNSKLTNIAPLVSLSQLEALSLHDTPKVFDLTPLERMPQIIALNFSGGMSLSTPNKAHSLGPIGTLLNLRDLWLTNIRVEKDGLKPLARCTKLEHLTVANTFDTEDYAFLAVKLPHTKCRHFQAAITTGSNKLNGTDTMVVGKRKPFLNSKTDAKRLAKYEHDFERLKEKFRSEKL